MITFSRRRIVTCKFTRRRTGHAGLANDLYEIIGRACEVSSAKALVKKSEDELSEFIYAAKIPKPKPVITTHLKAKCNGSATTSTTVADEVTDDDADDDASLSEEEIAGGNDEEDEFEENEFRRSS